MLLRDVVVGAVLVSPLLEGGSCFASTGAVHVSLSAGAVLVSTRGREDGEGVVVHPGERSLCCVLLLVCVFFPWCGYCGCFLGAVVVVFPSSGSCGFLVVVRVLFPCCDACVVSLALAKDQMPIEARFFREVPRGGFSVVLLLCFFCLRCLSQENVHNSLLHTADFGASRILPSQNDSRPRLTLLVLHSENWYCCNDGCRDCQSSNRDDDRRSSARLRLSHLL